MQETQGTQIWSLGQEDLLEKEMATHSSICAWEIPWAEKLGGLQSMGSQKILHDWAYTRAILFCIVAVQIYIPTNNVGGFPFLHTLSSIYCL